MGRGILWEVQNWSGDPPEGLGGVEYTIGIPGWVGEPTGRSRTNWGTHGEVRDGSGDPRGVQGRMGEPSGRSGTGWGTIEEVWDGTADPQGGMGWVVGSSRKFGTGWGTLPKVRDGSSTLCEVREG